LKIYFEQITLAALKIQHLGFQQSIIKIHHLGLLGYNGRSIRQLIESSIDVINDLDFAHGQALLKQALPMAKKIAALKRRAKAAGIPSIYVNDNFGRWQSDFQHVLRHCLDEEVCGKPLARLLQPDAEDYFVLKPKHSGFYSTTLELLLQALGARTLILTGIAGNSCVLFTANDAYMREYALVVPADCVASIKREENEYALKQMAEVLKADIRPSSELDFAESKQSGRKCVSQTA